MKTIGIVGSRRRNAFVDYEKVKSALKECFERGDSLVSGGCPQGADRFAETLAQDPFFTPCSILIHPANWDLYGRQAGFVRNTLIARDADILIACVAPDRKGGTEDTIKKFLVRFKKGEANLILV